MYLAHKQMSFSIKKIPTPAPDTITRNQHRPSNGGPVGWFGQKFGFFDGISPFSVLHYKGVKDGKSYNFYEHEVNHVWHHRLWGDAWLANYMFDLQTQRMIHDEYPAQDNFYDTQADNGF